MLFFLWGIVSDPIPFNFFVGYIYCCVCARHKKPESYGNHRVRAGQVLMIKGFQ